MSSSRPSLARSLYSESKRRLCERIAANIQSAGSVTRQIINGSKTSDILSNSAKSFAAQENAIENTFSNIKKLQISTKQFQMQLEDINQNCEKIGEVVERVN